MVLRRLGLRKKLKPQRTQRLTEELQELIRVLNNDESATST